MSALDWLLLGLIAVALVLALRGIRKHKGSCCGDCAHCSGCKRK